MDAAKFYSVGSKSAELIMPLKPYRTAPQTAAVAIARWVLGTVGLSCMIFSKPVGVKAELTDGLIKWTIPPDAG